MTLGNWMKENGFVAYKVFSATDASDLDTGWTDPSKFSIEGVVFYDGDEMTLFTDSVHQLLVKDKKTKTRGLDRLEEWIGIRFHPKNGPFTLIGYGSKKFDAPLLRYNFDFPGIVPDIDLSEIVADASRNHYGDYGRRYEIRSLAVLNRNKQSAIPHLSFLMRPIELLSEWKRGLARSVLKTLAAEVELIAGLFCSIVVKEELTITDERTERPASIQCDFVRDLNIYRFRGEDEDPLTLAYKQRLEEE